MNTLLLILIGVVIGMGLYRCAIELARVKHRTWVTKV